MALVLDQLRAIHERSHGQRATDAALPASGSVGMHCLAGTVGIGDNAAAAQKAIRVEAAALVKQAVREHLGEDKWSSMSPDEQDEASKLYGANCHRHLGNTWIDGGAKAEMRMLDEEIPARDTEAAKHLRCTTDVNKLIHAYSKGLGEGQNRYGKGFGEAKRAMLKEECGDALYQTVQRTDKGTRMDSCTEAAFDMYWNRKYDVQALKIAFYAKSNVLRDNLLVMLTSIPVIGCLRARAVVQDKFTIRHRFFAASSALEHWSVLEMAQVTDCARAMFVLMTQDPEAVATEDYDGFASLRATVPEYDEWLAVLDDSKKKSVDGQTEIHVYREVRAEIYNPTDADNQKSTEVMLKAIKAWGEGMLKTLDGGESLSARGSSARAAGGTGSRCRSNGVVRASRSAWGARVLPYRPSSALRPRAAKHRLGRSVLSRRAVRRRQADARDEDRVPGHVPEHQHCRGRVRLAQVLRLAVRQHPPVERERRCVQPARSHLPATRSSPPAHGNTTQA